MEVILIMASTVDGKIAKYTGQIVDWTGLCDKKHFSQLSREIAVVVMGSATYDLMSAPLPNRLNVVLTRDRLRKSNSDNLIFTNLEPDKIIDMIKSYGFVKIALVGGTTINNLFSRFITKIYLTIIPTIFGTGLSLFSEPNNFDLVFESNQLFDDGTMLLVYNVKRKI
jgi:dihydrofolate reductase